MRSGASELRRSTHGDTSCGCGNTRVSRGVAPRRRQRGGSVRGRPWFLVAEEYPSRRTPGWKRPSLYKASLARVPWPGSAKRSTSTTLLFLGVFSALQVYRERGHRRLAARNVLPRGATMCISGGDGWRCSSTSGTPGNRSTAGSPAGSSTIAVPSTSPARPRKVARGDQGTSWDEEGGRTTPPR